MVVSQQQVATRTKITGAQAAVAALEAAGVEVIFGIPSIHNLDIYDVLMDSQRIQAVNFRHEEGCSFAADGYARVGRRPGVVLTFSGPGAINALTGIGTAFADSSPVLVLAGQLDRSLIDRAKGELHEIRDQLNMFRPLTSWTARANSVAEIPALIARAMHTFQSARPRPILIELPLDVVREEAAVEIIPVPAAAPPAPDLQAIAAAAARLAGAKNPIIFAGGGVNSAAAQAELQRVAEILQAPVFNTAMAKGVLPCDHPLCLDTGFNLENTIGKLAAEADVVLAVGCRFSSQFTQRWAVRIPGSIIQIDVDPAEIGKNYPATGIVADARRALAALADALVAEGVQRPSVGSTLQVAKAKRWADLRAAYPAEIGVLEDLRTALGRDGILVADMNAVGLWCRRIWPAYRPKSFLFSMGFGPLGFGLPEAIGAKIAQPDRPLICVAGDAGYQFTGQELATAVEQKLAFPIVIFNDNCYGAIKHFQKKRFGRSFKVDLVNPDFVRLAEAYGARGVRLDGFSQLLPTLRQALESDRMTVIEAVGNLKHPDVVPLPRH